MENVNTICINNKELRIINHKNETLYNVDDIKNIIQYKNIILSPR